MLNEVKHLAVLGKILLKLRETLRFAQGDKIFNTLRACKNQPRRNQGSLESREMNS